MTNPTPFNDDDRADLVAYLDGELDEAAARAWEVRLHTDPKARAEADALTRAWELLDYLPTPRLSDTFTSRTVERITAAHPRRRLWPRRLRPWAVGLSWAAAVLLAATTGYGLVVHRAGWPAESPAPPDQQVAADLRLLQNLYEYECVETISFLQELDHDDLFGDES